jgi:Protein of unknown function (DUF2958)
MILLTPDLRFTLRANDINRRAAMRDSKPEPNPVPVVKFFNPLGAATWIATELFGDDDTLFGLADLGFGCPELGEFSLSEIASIRLPFGLGIERDIGFESPHSISRWADAARVAGSIAATERILIGTARPSGNELPPTGG